MIRISSLLTSVFSMWADSGLRDWLLSMQLKAEHQQF